MILFTKGFGNPGEMLGPISSVTINLGVVAGLSTAYHHRDTLQPSMTNRSLLPTPSQNSSSHLLSPLELNSRIEPNRCSRAADSTVPSTNGRMISPSRQYGREHFAMAPHFEPSLAWQARRHGLSGHNFKCVYHEPARIVSFAMKRGHRVT